MNNQLLSTSIERVFRHLPSGLYQEFYLFFIHNLDIQSRNILSSKLDKIIVGKLYRKGSSEERAIFGDEVTFHFPNEEKSSNMIPVVNLNELSCKRLSLSL